MAESVDRAPRQLQAGNLAQAEQLYRQAVELAPNDPVTHYNLGVALEAQQLGEAAIDCYRRALQLRSDFFEAACNLGTALWAQGQLDEAADCFRRVITLRPEFSAAHVRLAHVLSARGLFEEAAASCRQALQSCPSNCDAWLRLGQSLCRLRRWDEAIESFRRGLQVRPHDPGLLNGLGAALGQLECFAEADACFREALGLKPDFPEAHYNLGNSLRDQGKTIEALACYEAALKLRPEYPAARFNRCLLWLLLGEYRRGWPEYIWRWRCPGAPARRFRQPLWDGANLGGRTILLHDDQGLGDFMQMIRFAPLVQRRGGVVVVECPLPLVPLLRGAAGIDRLIPAGEPLPDCAVHAWLFALPGALGTTLETIPAHVPYLAADLVKNHPRPRDSSHPRELRIGIVWQGSPTHQKDRHRSVPLAQLAPLARVPGVRLFSLQKGARIEESAGADFPVTDLAGTHAHFGETASAISNLDLVIGVDTSVIHCAGALGVPTWVALPFVNDWRWLLGRADSPWYPTVRLFRQQQPGAWQNVFESMASELHKMS